MNSINFWLKFILLASVSIVHSLASSNLFSEIIQSQTAKANGREPSAFNCTAILVESIPENLTYRCKTPINLSTYKAWSLLTNIANHNITIASFYWTMLGEDVINSSSSLQGEDIFAALLRRSKDINISIVQNGRENADNDLDKLKVAGASIYRLDFDRLLGKGIQHAKVWTIDRLHGYLGSANMDWRSLTQIKELGILFTSCSSIAKDLEKVTKSFMYMSTKNSTQVKWPSELMTYYNKTSPMFVNLNGNPSLVYFSMSPPSLSPQYRSDDLDAILDIISKARSFVYISVMTYTPTIVSYNNKSKTLFWSPLDDAIRAAAINNKIDVRLLISKWKHSSSSSSAYLRSLQCINGVERSSLRIRYFVVPSVTEEQAKIPYARVNHNKYMVTDRAAYIGTSNWSGDYFLFSGGVGFVAEESATDESSDKLTIRKQLQEVFLRDWNSEHTLEL